MKKNIIPTIVSVEAFQAGNFNKELPILIYYTDGQFLDFISQVKPSLAPRYDSIGLRLIPLDEGYLALPVLIMADQHSIAMGVYNV